MPTPHLVVLGRQGAGKGTQCEYIARAYGIVHLSTGELFREAVRDATPSGREVEPLLAHGSLVPDALVLAAVADHIARHDLAARGFVLDGFPRTLPQAISAFGDAMAASPNGPRRTAPARDAVTRLGCRLDLAIAVAVPTAVVLRRLASRRVCPVCGATVTVADPSIPSAPCPNGHGPAVRRADDSDEAIARRLALYDQETGPVAEWFSDRGQLARVDGVGTPAEVFARVAAAIDAALEPSAAPA